MDPHAAEQVTQLLERLNTAIRSHRATLRVPTPDGEGLVLVASAGVGQSVLPEVRTDSNEAALIAYRSNEKIVVNDYASYTPIIQSAIDEELGSLIYLPVGDDKKTLGVLSIGSKETDAFRPEVTSILEAYALALGGLIERTNVSQRSEVAAEIGRLVSSDLGIDEVYIRFAEQARKVVDFDRIAICTLDLEQDNFEIAYMLGTHVPRREIGTSLRLTGTFNDAVIKAGKPVVFCAKNESEVTELYPALISFFRSGLKSYIGTPLVANDQVVAVLVVNSVIEHAYSLEDAGHLQVIGDQIAGAIANGIAAKMLQESEARSDVLLEDAPQGILVANDDGVITRINKRLEFLFGYTREELVGRPIEVLIPESIKADHIAHRLGYIKHPVSRQMGEGLRLSGRRKDGSEIPVEISLSNVDTSEGNLTIAHISDDTHRRELEDLQKSREMRLSGELEAREAELELADQVAEIITSTLDISQDFPKFAEEARNLVAFDHATIIVVDHSTESLIVDRFLRVGSMAQVPQTIWDLKGSQTEQAMLTGQTIIRDDLGLETVYTTDEYLNEAGIQSTILTPLVYNDRTIGSMLLASCQPKAFGPREQGILERLARQIAPAVENARLYEEAVSRTAQLECLVALAEILGQTIPFEEKVSQALEQLVQVVQCYSARFRLPDALGQYLVLTAEAGTPDGPEFTRPERLGEGSLAYQAFHQGHPLVVSDYQNHPHRSAFLDQMGDRSVVFLPISIGDRPAALVTVDSKELGYFTPDRVRLLTAIGEGLGTLLENSRLSEELRSTTEEMTLVDQVAKIVTSTLDIGQVFAEFAGDVRNLIDFDLATINVIDPDAERFVAGHFLWEGSLEDYQITWDLKGSLTERAILSGETIIEQDLREHSGYSTDGFFAERGLRSGIMTPLAYNDRIIGSMCLASKIVGAFGIREQRILERLSNQIAPAVENARLYSESIARAAELKCLLNLAEILGQTIPFQEKIHQVLEQLVEVADGFSAHFRVPTATGEELELAALALIPGEPDYSWPEKLGEGSLSFEAFRQARPLVVDDYKNHPDANPVLAQTEIRSAVYVPVMAGGQAAALVTVNSKELGHFTPDRLRLLTAIGEGLGALLENSRLSEELQSSNQEMELADQVARIITSTLDIEQEYQRFATEVKKLVDFDRATLLDVDRSTNSYAIRSSWGIDIPSLWTGRNIPLDGSALRRTLNSDERILVEDLAPPFRSIAHPSLFEAGLRSHLMVPLIFNDQITGGIAVLSRKKGAFGDREKRIMQRLAGQIAPAVENARLFRQAQERTQEIERLHESTNRILDSNPSALVVLRGSDREVVMVNSSFRATFRPEKNQVEGQPISQVLEWVGLEEYIGESMAWPLGEGQKEMKYIGRDGTERWFSVSAAPLLLEQGTGYEDEVLLVLNDITEQRQQQERFQEQARLASVGQLASGVAHEINNPLAAIHGYSELLQMADLPPQANEDALKIQWAVQRAAKIVQNLLSFARKSEPEKQYLSVASVVDQAMALKARDFELENIRVTTNHSKGVPPTMVDEQQIIQVMLNILTNAEQAIKAGQGHGEITIATRLVKGFIGIKVSDDGLGIPAEHLHSIFDPFFTTKEVGEGTGLGLSICYGIVRDHGGKMWAESAPVKGATFHIELPVLPDVAPAEAQSTETDGATVKARRILVVDDEPEVRNILGRVLSADGHDVSLASDGKDAWKLIQKNRFDSIFLDLRMPGVDGQALYKQIIEYSPDLAKKVVFITGDTARADTERFLESTSSPVLGKPFTIEAIRQLL